MDYYKQIFKRKSFHLFRETEQMTKEDINKLNAFIGSVKPLNPQIKTEICIVPESETTCKRGGEYCILFYSEQKEEYLRNIGYIGEQIDLYLASQKCPRESSARICFGQKESQWRRYGVEMR